MIEHNPQITVGGLRRCDIPPSFAAYEANRDLALKAIIDYQKLG